MEVDTLGELVRNILGKCFVTDLNIIRQRDFSISLYLSTSKFAVSGLLCHILKFGGSKLPYFIISVTGD